MKKVCAILALVVLSLAANAADDKSPDEIYAERLALAERNACAKGKEAHEEKTWEQRAEEERDAYQTRHDAALRAESPEARVKRERENQRWEAERAAHESWCAEHPAECAQAEADRQREQAEQAGAAQKRGEIALARVEWELAARRRNALLAQADPFVALQNALAGRRAQTPSLLDLISQQAKEEKAAAHAQLLAQISQQAEAAAYALKTQLEVDQKRASAQFEQHTLDKNEYDLLLGEFAAVKEKLGTDFDRIIAFKNQATAWIQQQQAIRQEQQLNAAQATAEKALRVARDAEEAAAEAERVARGNVQFRSGRP